jgi:hypothetical protein
MASDYHYNAGNNPAEMHGILWRTVANAAALAALTIVSADVTQRKVILQTDTGQLWTPLTTTPTFQLLMDRSDGLDTRGMILRRRVIREDYDMLASGATGIISATSGLIYTGGTTGTFGTSTANERGVFNTVTGTGTTAAASMTGAVSNLPTVLASANGYYKGDKVKLATASDGTNTYIQVFGEDPNPTGVTATGGTQFYYSNADTHWGFRAGNAFSTLAYSTVVATIGQWYLLEQVKLPGSTDMNFMIDGVNVGVVTGGMPTNPMSINNCTKKSAGAASILVAYDWTEAQYNWAAARNTSGF